MEVSTVSPPPATPTEGDDPCEINTSDVAIHSAMLLIGLCGLAGNGAFIWLLKRKRTNVIIFALAVIDFLFLLFTVPSALLFLVEDVSCSIIMPLVYLRFLFQLSVVPCYLGLWLLTDPSIGMAMSKFCQLCCHCHLPMRLLSGMFSVQSCAFFALIIVIAIVTFLCPSHKREQCQVALISMLIITLLLFAAPMVISRSIDFIKAKCGSQQQQLKKRDIVIFLTVLLTLPFILVNFLSWLGYIVGSSQVFFLLTCINSTSKPFIYFLVGRSWRNCSMECLRESLQRVFEEQEDNSANEEDANTDTVV